MARVEGGGIAADAGLPSRLTLHPFRVTAVTDLLSQGIPPDAFRDLARNASPRTTGLHDRRRKGATRTMIERISI
jgi:integrase/recombinase XerD